jgi:undecaprenyl-phosphate 4-deoxy-4-formamido-L-arabinose transferase
VYLLGKPKKLYLSSFKIINRGVVDEIIAYKGPFPYIDALILRCTDNIGSVYVNHHSRQTGKSNYTFRKLFSLYLNVFINFSNKPLRLITIFGAIISILSFISIGIIIYEKTMLQNVTPGWAFLAIAMLFLIGLTFIVIGILGEYIGKIMMTINQQPQFVVKSSINVNEFSEKVMEVTNDRESIRV